MEPNQTLLLLQVMFTTTGATVLDVEHVTLAWQVNFGISRVSHCKLRGLPLRSSQVGYSVVLPPNPEVGEPFTLPQNAGFSVEYIGLFAQSKWEL